jgi:hypothetical protein
MSRNLGTTYCTFCGPCRYKNQGNKYHRECLVFPADRTKGGYLLTADGPNTLRSQECLDSEAEVKCHE